MNSNGTELEQVIHTHRTSCRSGWPSLCSWRYCVVVEWDLAAEPSRFQPPRPYSLFLEHGSAAKTLISHPHNTASYAGYGWPRGFGELNPNPHSWIFTRLIPFQSSLILFHFRYGPNTCAREVRARCSFALWQKSRRNHCSCVWKEAVSGTIFAPEQKPCGRAWTINLNNGNLFMVRQWSVPEYTNNLSSIIINVVSEETL